MYGRNEFVGDLQTIDEKAKGVTATIPLEVIEAIDKGRNPQLVTYQMLYVFNMIAFSSVGRDQGRYTLILTYGGVFGFCLCRESCAEADYAARGKLKAMEELR